MKVYVVTSGMYSDYSIVAVFTVKEKAEAFVKYNERSWDGLCIEEYDTDDDYSCDGYITCKCEFTINKDCCRAIKETKESKKLDFKLYDMDAYLTEAKEEDTYLDYDCNNSYNHAFLAKLTIKRSYKDGLFTEEEVKDKVLKIGHDLCARIKSLYELEDYSMQDIADYINGEKEKKTEETNK